MRIELGLRRSIVFVALGLFCSRGMSAEPANPKSNPASRALLDYFHDLSGRTAGKRILSGQFSDFGNGASLRIMERIHEKNGHWPALIGVDYADFPRGSLTTKVPNQVAMDYWKQGALVTVRVDGSDDVGLSELRFFVNDGAVAASERQELVSLP